MVCVTPFSRTTGRSPLFSAAELGCCLDADVTAMAPRPRSNHGFPLPPACRARLLHSMLVA